MNLQEFTSEAISSIVQAIKQADGVSDREIKLTKLETSRTIEFDIAVSATEKLAGDVHGGIKVLSLIDAGGKSSSEITNSTVSRIKFGVNVDRLTKEEMIADKVTDRQHVASVRANKQLNSAR